MDVNNGIEMKLPPVFIHSLFRASSTYFFSRFRETGNYTCFQEPLHEALMGQSADLEEIANLGTENDEFRSLMRHPKLDAPYFQETLDLQDHWAAHKDVKISLADIFPESVAKPTVNFLSALISSAEKRPMIQECRTSFKVGRIKEELGGTHIVLLRHPWSQWWSGKVTAYFETVYLTFANSEDRPRWLAEIAKHFGLGRIQVDNPAKVLGYFETHRTTAEQSYAVYFAFWCLAVLQARTHADLILEVDSISTSEHKISEANAALAKIGIEAVIGRDFKVPMTKFSATEHAFYKQIEATVFGYMAKRGVKTDDIDHLMTTLARLHKVRVSSNATGNDEPANLRSIVLRMQNREATNTASLIQDFMTTQNADIADAEKTLEATKKAWHDNEASLKERARLLSQENRKLDSRLREITSEKALTNERLVKAQTESALLASDLQSMKKERNRIEAKFSNREAKNRELQATMRVQKLTLAKAEKRADRNEQTLESLDLELAQANALLRQWRNTNQTISERIDDKEKQLNRTLRKINDLEDALNLANQEVQALQRHKDELDSIKAHLAYRIISAINRVRNRLPFF